MRSREFVGGAAPIVVLTTLLGMTGCEGQSAPTQPVVTRVQTEAPPPPALPSKVKVPPNKTVKME